MKIDRTDNLVVRSSQREGFDRRIVPYEEIHGIQPEDFERLVDLVAPFPGAAILDAGAGYGAVTREILMRHPDKGLRFTLLDISDVQLRRAEQELNSISGRAEDVQLIQDSIVHPTMCEPESFDIVVAKMVVHEVPNFLQVHALRALQDLLVPGGKIVVWDVSLGPETQDFFQRVVRHKDRLAGYKYMVNSRYFLRDDEWVERLNSAGFVNVELKHPIGYHLETRKRLEHELGSSEQLLDAWHSKIRSLARRVPTAVLSALDYFDGRDSIRFSPPKAVYTAQKPSR